MKDTQSTIKDISAKHIYKIPKKVKPSKSEVYSRKNRFEYTLYSKNKFPSSTGLPVQASA